MSIIVIFENICLPKTKTELSKVAAVISFLPDGRGATKDQVFVDSE